MVQDCVILVRGVGGPCEKIETFISEIFKMLGYNLTFFNYVLASVFPTVFNDFIAVNCQ